MSCELGVAPHTLLETFGSSVVHAVATFFKVKKNNIFCFQHLKWAPSKRNGRLKFKVSMLAWNGSTW